MSSVTYQKLFEPSLLTTGAATIYTVPSTSVAGTVLRNMVIRVTNYSTATRSTTLHAVPSGGSVSNTNAFANAIAIPVNDYVDFQVPLLEVSGALQALADQNAALNIQFISGNLFTPG